MSDVLEFQFVPKDPALLNDPLMAGWLEEAAQRVRGLLETELREEMDTLRQFFEECVVIDPQGRCKAQEVYEAYQAWTAQGLGSDFRCRRTHSG
jgi:phage/plasmid-associated DNA primase